MGNAIVALGCGLIGQSTFESCLSVFYDFSALIGKKKRQLLSVRILPESKL